jgi:hypothetical protein
MAGQREGQQQQYPANLEEKPLIEGDLTDNVAHAGPPAWWLDGEHRRQPPDAAAKHQLGEPPKEEEIGLIVGDARHLPPSLPQLLPPKLDIEEEENQGAPDPAMGSRRPTPARHGGILSNYTTTTTT